LRALVAQQQVGFGVKKRFALFVVCRNDTVVEYWQAKLWGSKRHTLYH